MTDHVSKILAQWKAERPELDVSPMAVIGRLSRAALVVESRLNDTFAQHGLDASSFDVLATLLRSGAPYVISPAQLSQDAMITTSAVAQRLNRLESRGLVAREANPADGRGTLVALTAAGKKLVEQILPAHLETERAIIADLSGEERILLAGLLQRLTNTTRGENNDQTATI